MTEDRDVSSTEEPNGLLPRARAGDPRAFDELFGRHRAALHRAVARRLGPSLRARIDPSDVVQDAHVEALERLDEFAGRRPMPFRVWLLRTALQRVGKLRRYVSAARRDAGRELPMTNHRDFHSTSSPVGRLAAAGPTPSQQAAAREVANHLHSVLQRLPEPDRLILGMRAFEGLSYEEAGARLGIEPAAARKRYGRALLRLRALLLDEGLTESHLWTDT
jgi:RNA polymerase sigma-70 factor (ECF subfamily)